MCPKPLCPVASLDAWPSFRATAPVLLFPTLAASTVAANLQMIQQQGPGFPG